VGVSPEDWGAYLGKAVVVDTDSSFLYIGTLKGMDDTFLRLQEADVHDSRETSTTKEQYAINARRNGVRPNRKEVAVRKKTVVSVSLLEDVILY
jgi:small nuclear ribonucleoprotein (snRNP)-like protein